MYNEIEFFNAMRVILISLTALFISIIALSYTIKTFYSKIGHDVRGNYFTRQSNATQDDYIYSLTLENLKDRPLIIFEIYLKIGNSYYLELENHEDDPLIIPSLQVYRSNYDPIIFYSVNTKRIKIDDILSNEKVKKQIILSTTDGKYKVKTGITPWSPIPLYFRNCMTAIITPMRIMYDDKAYGINIKYLVRFTRDDDKLVVAIHADGFSLTKFTNFQLTKESLESKDALLHLFEKQKEKGNILYKEIDIIEYQKGCIERYNLDKIEILEARPYNFFQYHIFGRMLSSIDDIKTNIKNKKLLKEIHKQELRKKPEEQGNTEQSGTKSDIETKNL